VIDLDDTNKNEHLFPIEVLANASLNTVLGDVSAVATANDDVLTTTAISSGGYSNANLNLFKTSFDGGYSQITAGAKLGSGSAFEDQYSLSKQLKFYFYDDTDAKIQGNASLYASLSEPFVSTVPELGTNATLLLT
jgi:hypothetical protein